jgi:hypothetical protein
MIAPAPAVSNFRLDAALSYAARGWRVIPLHWPTVTGPKARCSCSLGTSCASIGKHPLTENGLKDASADPARIRAWWAGKPAANVGIVTGRDSGLVVLDIDLKDDGPGSLERLEQRHQPLPSSVQVITGSGGEHRFYAHPIHTNVPNSSRKIGDGLDVRGDGGYVVAPPSLHASGNRYGWDLCGDPDEAPLAELPAWLLAEMVPPPPRPSSGNRPFTTTDRVRVWLGNALAKATVGNRSETGHWLACQLRDNRVERGEAESVMRDYASRVPAGDHAYTESEALATYASVMKSPARDPAVSQTPRRSNTEPAVNRDAVAEAPAPGASSELDAYMTGIIEGRIYNVPFPWDAMTNATQALQPGSFCLLGGDPGVGKTFAILQSLRHWHANGHNPAVFFAEKDRKFYMRRLLAQLEGNGNLVNLEWIKSNPEAARGALARHREYIEELGKSVWTKQSGKLSLELMTGWILDRARDGHRVIVIDPITAVDPGAERWSKESDFVQRCQDLMNEYGLSLLLTTHPKQSSGKAGGTTSGHDAAGGAAYFRFVDSMIWFTRAKQPRRVECNHPIGGMTIAKTSHFARLLKTREGMGAGWEIAYDFTSSLTFTEYGVVMKDVKGWKEDPEDPFGAPADPFRAPTIAAPSPLDLEDLP